MEEYASVGKPGVEQYEAMWTTEKADWQLWPARRGELLPVRPGTPPMACVIEDNDLAQEVVARMIAAGIPVVTAHESPAPASPAQPTPPNSIDLAGASLGEMDEAALVRTDYSDQQVWTQLLEDVLAVSEEGFRADVTVIEHREFDGMDGEAVRSAVTDGYPFSFLIVADRITVTHLDHPLLVIDLLDEPGRTLRVVPDAIQSIENNLSISNMFFADFADSPDADGIFRGFPDGP